MDKKSLDIIVEEFFDTGKLVLNEWSDKFWNNSDYPRGLMAHLFGLYNEGNVAYNRNEQQTAIEKYRELLTLFDDNNIMEDKDRQQLTLKRGMRIGEVRTRLEILLTTSEPEEEEISPNLSNIRNNIGAFFSTFQETDNLYRKELWDVHCNVNKGTQQECFNKLKAYIRIVNIWYEKLIPLLGLMNKEEKKLISREGESPFRMFEKPGWGKYDKIDDLVNAMGEKYMKDLRLTYQAAINKIHELTKEKEGEDTELSDIDLSIDYYRELRNIISKMSKKLPYQSKTWWYRRIDDNIFDNLRSKLILKKAEKTDFQGLIDLSNELRKIIGNADDELIKIIIKRLKNTSYVRKMVDEYNLSFDNREDLINWVTKFRKNQYFKQFEEVVRDIEPEEIEDTTWDDNLVPLLNDFSVDNEEVNELVDIINQKENKLNDFQNYRGNDINHGKVQIPKLQLEIPQLKEQLKLIDPIKEFFDSNPKWRIFLTYWKYCPDAQEEYEKIEKFLKKSYGNKKNYEKALLTTSQIKERKKPYNRSTTVTLDCDITFSGLTKSLKLQNKRETLQDELISNFEENLHELVLKCIRLVDQIFMSIVQNGVYEQNQQQKLLKKYKSYINMIKIYSKGENQKEKLSQLIYDLNQLKGVVDSYDSLRNEATPVDAEGDENDGRRVKLLTKNTLRTLLKNISFNSWDANEIKEYFVTVREHKNVAYEKSFEKECDNQQYFEIVGGGNNPAIVSGNNNNITLVHELLKKDDTGNLLPVSVVTETIFEQVRDLLNNEDLVNSKLKKYDIKTTQNVTLTPYNREGENITIVADTFIEVKDARPGDYHFSEFFGVYKNKKETDTAYNTITTSGDPEQNLARYEQFVEELVYRFNGNEGKTIIKTIKNRIGGIFFENYLFAHIDDITFSWSPTGQGTSRENRVSIRVIPDMDKLYYWKEGNSNCGNQFKYPNCETDSGCVPDNLEESITNFFDTGNFEF